MAWVIICASRTFAWHRHHASTAHCYHCSRAVPTRALHCIALGNFRHELLSSWRFIEIGSRVVCCDEGPQVPLSSTSITLSMNNPNEQMGGGENASLLRCCNPVSRSHPPSLTFSPSLPPLPFLTLFWPTWDMEVVSLDVRQVFLWVPCGMEKAARISSH